MRTALYTVTFAEILTACLMAHMMSMLVLSVTKPEKAKQIQIVLHTLLLAHALVLLVGCFNGMIYYFDESNNYARGGGMPVIYVASILYYVIAILVIMLFWNFLTKKMRYVLVYFFTVTLHFAFFFTQLQASS